MWTASISHRDTLIRNILVETVYEGEGAEVWKGMWEIVKVAYEVLEVWNWEHIWQDAFHMYYLTSLNRTYIFPLASYVQTRSGVHPASCTVGTGGPFSGAKARPRRDADHSPPSTAEVENEELYFLSPKHLRCV